jgi:hypothetical protein
MKKDIRTLAALLIASATFVACSSDDDIANETQQPANGKYTLTINASKSDRANTRALDLSGKTLTASWATTENVFVQKSGEWASGSLKPQANGSEATLKGELSGIIIAANDVLTLQFPRQEFTYAEQVGTLADIAANFDYATASVTVASVNSGKITVDGTTVFASQQAIVKFTLLDKANGATSLNATELVVNDGTTVYTITPTSATSEIYVAIPGFSEKTVTLTATVGSDTYTFEKSDVTFTNGKYYEITVKMAKMAPALNLTSPAVGQVIGDDGKNYDYASLPGGVTAVAKICYVSGSNGLALALADEGQMNWSTAISTCAAHTPAFTGGTWKLASKDEWDNMINVAGFATLRDGFTSVGGSNLESGLYWSSSERNASLARYYSFFNGSWSITNKDSDNQVRACLAF